MERQRLTELARLATDRPALELDDWQHDDLYGGVGAINDARHLQRYRGIGRDGAEAIPWSLVLKWFRPVGSDDPTWLSYWRREPLAFESGLLGDLPGGVVAPRCFGVDRYDDGAVGIWLEEVTDEEGPVWPVARYALAARQLGEMGGEYISRGALPRHPWLGERYLRRYAAGRDRWLEQVRQARDQPVVGQLWDDDLVAASLDLYARREPLFDAHERLPPTFVHGDTGRRNLFGRRDPESTVLIDWGYCGRGVVGEDLHLMVVWTAQMFDVDVADLDELERVVLAGYQEGLGDAGLDLDPRVARLGYLVPAAIRNTIMPFGLVYPDAAQRRAIEESYGHPFDEWAARTIAVRRFMISRAAQAHELIAEGGATWS